MKNLFKKFAIFNLFIYALFSGLNGKIYANEVCDHCEGPAHTSDMEKCLKCNRLVRDCDFSHNVQSLTYEDILNASNSNALIDILFKIKNIYLSMTGRHLPLHDIFERANQAFRENGIVLHGKGLRDLKDVLKRRTFNEVYLAACLKNVMPSDFATSEEYQKMLKIASVSASLHQVEYPERLRYGIVLVWCGSAVSLLSGGTLAPFGSAIIGLGINLTLEGGVQYVENKTKYEHELAEQERLKAEKEVKNAAKKAAKKAEKEERRRQKALEKERKRQEKEERRRQKDERRRLKEELKKQK